MMAKLRKTTSQTDILDNLLKLRAHFDTLCGFISNFAFIADKQSHNKQVYAINTTKLFLYALLLQE